MHPIYTIRRIFRHFRWRRFFLIRLFSESERLCRVNHKQETIPKRSDRVSCYLVVCVCCCCRRWRCYRAHVERRLLDRSEKKRTESNKSDWSEFWLRHEYWTFSRARRTLGKMYEKASKRARDRQRAREGEENGKGRLQTASQMNANCCRLIYDLFTFGPLMAQTWTNTIWFLFLLKWKSTVAITEVSPWKRCYLRCGVCIKIIYEFEFD